jgi:predicted MFS family arabinose efflux permease
MKFYTVALLATNVFFLFADQNLLAPNLSIIAKEFGFSDRERDEKLGGYIAFGFFIIGAPVALLVGYLSDIVQRNILFGIVVILGSSASLSTYWTQSYGELFVCRIFTGISIGGIIPIIFSLLGDLFPGSSRIYVSTIIGLSQSAGIAVGQFIAGMIGPELGWRVPFVMIAVPSIICALLVILTVVEPDRGVQEKAVQVFRQSTNLNYSYQTGKAETSVALATEQEVVVTSGAEDFTYSEKIEWSKILEIFRTPSAVIIFIQGFPGCIPWGMIYVFMNDYFSTERGMTIQAATGLLTCFGVGGLAGQIFGGYAGQRLYNLDPRFQTLLMGTSTLIAVGPMLYLINAPTSSGSAGALYFVALLGGFVVNINGPNVRVVLQVKLHFFSHTHVTVSLSLRIFVFQRFEDLRLQSLLLRTTLEKD